MSDKDKTVNNPADSQTEDNIVIHTGIKKEEPSERNIRPAPVVHTSGNDDIYIPDTSPDEFSGSTVISRFIKKNETPFVSVTEAKEPESDAKDIDKYSDRLSIKAPEKKTFSGHPTKQNGYSSVHASDSQEGRMILREEEAPEAQENKGDDAEPEAQENKGGGTEPEEKPTKEMVLDGNGAPVPEDILPAAPTRPVETPKGSLLREIADTADDGVRRNPDQLMMEGFDSVGKEDEEEKAREQSELQHELRKTRQKRINAFKFWDKKPETEESTTQDEKFCEKTEKLKDLPSFLQKLSDTFAHFDTSFTPVHCEEYTDFNSRKEVFAALMDAKRGVLYRLFAVALIGIVIFIIDLTASVSASSNANGFFTVLGGNYTLYITLNLAALLAAAVMMLRDLKTGLFSLLKVHPKADTSLLLLMLAALAQNICAYFTQLKLEENFHLLAPAAILLCVPYLLSKLFYYDNTRHCFKGAAAKSEKSYLRRVSDENLVAELLRDRDSAAQNVVYSGRTRFVENFLAGSADSAYAGMPSSRSVLITAAASFVVGIVTAILMKDAVYGITAVVLSLAMSFPVSCLAATGYKLSGENKKLSVKSSFVQSHKDARDFAAIDNIVVRDTDLFSAKVTNCLSAKGVSEKQAKFCAAVLTSKYGGPLNAALRESVASLEDKFPAAESLVYEEKLGLSAWVSGCKVLLGTHALLVNHNVELPEESIVSTFLNEDETPVYLALEGRFAAVFGVKYSCFSENADSLKALVKNGTSILLSTTDANLNETAAEAMLGLPECSVRTLSVAAAEKLSVSMQAITDFEEAGIVFTDSFDSLCRCACAAIRLDHSKRMAKLVCEAGAYVSAVIAAVLAFTGAFTGVSSVVPVLVQLLWFAICFAVSLLLTPSGSGSAPDIRLPKKKPSDKTGAPRKTAAEPENDPPVKTEEEEEEVRKDSADAPEETVEDAKKPDEQTEIKDNPSQEDEQPGVISESTYAALDALAGDSRETKKTEKTNDGKAPVKKARQEEEPEEDAADERDAVNEKLDKAKKIAGRFLSRFTVVDDEPEEDEEEEEEEEVKEKSKPVSGKKENNSRKSSKPIKNARSRLPSRSESVR